MNCNRFCNPFGLSNTLLALGALIIGLAVPIILDPKRLASFVDHSHTNHLL